MPRRNSQVNGSNLLKVFLFFKPLKKGGIRVKPLALSFNLSNEVPVNTLLPSDLHDLKWVYRYLAVLNEHVDMISNYAKSYFFISHINIHFGLNLV